MIVRGWKGQLPFVKCLFITGTTRTSGTELRLFSIRSRGSIWNVCLHRRDNHDNALATYRGVFDLEAIYVLRKNLNSIS